MPIPQRTDEVVLFQDDDQHELRALGKAVEAAATSSDSPRRLGDDDDVLAAAKAYDEFLEQAAERGTKVAIKAIPGKKWREHVAAHPPREKNEDDAEWGFNHLTLGDAVVPECVTSIDGQPASQDDLDNLNDGDYSKIYAAVLRLNTGRGPDPKASISATLRRTSPETSESPERLG
jgi:hypothetical protein